MVSLWQFSCQESFEDVALEDMVMKHKYPVVDHKHYRIGARLKISAQLGLPGRRLVGQFLLSFRV